MALKNMEDLVALCKRRGFIFQSADIYGGLKGVYDWGPIGVELKNNVKRELWSAMVYNRDDVEGLDAAILTNKLVLRYSGHEDTFSDPLVDCKKCKMRMREDKLKEKGVCDYCGSTDLTEPRPFNLMFKTTVGPIVDDESYAYLRPETAQGIFTNFKNVMDTTSRKIPFGIAQIGKAFRNEITPRNFIFRVRELEQMELEFFVKPGEDEQWHKYWIDTRKKFWISMGLSEENLHFEVHKKEDLSHYSKATTDICYRYPHGIDEMEGIANRTDFDLGSHTKNQSELGITAKVKNNQHSISEFSYTDVATGQKFVPFVIEPSAGVERSCLALICEAYTEETLDNGETRIVLKFKKNIAPIKAAVIPLAKNNDQLVSKATEIKNELQSLGIGRIAFENTGNIGKAYRKHDEIGTPLCITVDLETLEQNPQTVTVRNRDTMEQIRVPVSEIASYIQDFYKK